MKKINKKYIGVFFLISLFTITFCSLTYTTWGQSNEEEEIKTEYQYNTINCPLNTSDILESPFLTNDPTHLNDIDYKNYMTSFKQSAYSSVVSEMADYYTEIYNLDPPIDTEIMSHVVETQDVSPILHEDLLKTHQIQNEINNCINTKLKIIITVEDSIRQSEYNTFVTNSVLGMMNSMQNDFNYFRTDILEPQVDALKDETNDFIYTP